MYVEIEYTHFPFVDHEDVVFGVESLESCIAQLSQQHTAHWEETEYGYMGDVLDADYDLVEALETDGRLLIFTMRDQQGALVGNCLIVKGRSIQMRDVIVATEETFFIDPKYRNRGYAINFISYIKTILKDAGVTYLRMTDRYPSGGKSLEKLMDAHGFTPVARTYLAKL